MHIMIREGKSHTLYGVKKAYYEKLDKAFYLYLVLETGKTIEVEFDSEEELEYVFSSLYNYGKFNLCGNKYKIVE